MPPIDQVNVQLAEAFKKGEFRKIKKLVRQGADINGKDAQGRPYAFALPAHRTDLWEALFKLGLNPNLTNANGLSLLQAFALTSSYSLDRLVKAGGDVRQYGPDIVLSLLEGKHDDIEEYLSCLTGLDWDVVHEPEKNSLLQTAILKGRKDAGSYILGNCRNLEHKNAEGVTALELAEKHLPGLAAEIRKKIELAAEDRRLEAQLGERNWFSRHFYHSGFILDLAFGALAFFVTPWILAQTAVAHGGQQATLLGYLLLTTMALELVGLQIFLPDIFRRNHAGSFSGFSLLLIWIAHFALQVSLAEGTLFASLVWHEKSQLQQITTVLIILKEFYLGGLLAVCLMAPLRMQAKKPALRHAAMFLLAFSAFILFTVAFESMSHAEILEGIDTNIADFLPYRVFHITFVFLLIYWPARLAFTLEEKLSLRTRSDRYKARAGLVVAIILGTWNLYTGPEVHPHDLTVRDKRGQSELMRHITYGPQGYLERLIKAGIDVNATDHRGATALHKAVYWARNSAVKMLLANGANVNLAMADGKTPVMLAFREGWSGLATRLEILEMLLRAGADPLLKDKSGRNLSQQIDHFRAEILPVIEKYKK